MSLPVATEHPELFHYTTRQGLEGILKSQSLWGTNYRHLNDSTEVILFKEHLKEILVSTVREVFAALVFDGRATPGSFSKWGGFEKAVKQEAAGFVESCFRSLEDEIYIASFCGTSRDEYVRKNGLLSQWRGYGKNGGFCIEFDSRRLLGLLHREAMRFEHLGGHVSSVVYSDDEQTLIKEFQLSSAILHNYLKGVFEGIVSKSTEEPDAEKAGEFLNALICCITRYKHRAFKEEHEVRAVWVSVIVTEEYREEIRRMGGEVKPGKPTKYRGSKPNQISYVDLLEDLGEQLPINRVIVGPQNEQRQIAIGIEALCKPLGIPVECSEIPYVTR